jgi:Holliday junction resolvase-like predicted endonuclease
MARDRDFITEIVEIRSRHPDASNRLAVFVQRMDDLRLLAKEWLADSWHGDDEKCRFEALRYIPIAIVASMQGWLRFAIRDLVDTGEPFSKNSKGLKIQFDHDLVMALAAKTLTAGEIISHFLSCNRIEDILATLEKVSGVQFPPLMRSVNLGSGQYPIPVSGIYEQIVPIVTDTFRLRHIFAHELAPHEKVDPTTIVRRVGACQVFITACDRVMVDVLNGTRDGNRTQIANEGIEPSTPSGGQP